MEKDSSPRKKETTLKIGNFLIQDALLETLLERKGTFSLISKNMNTKFTQDIK
jgi:hypothetical protein